MPLALGAWERSEWYHTAHRESQTGEAADGGKLGRLAAVTRKFPIDGLQTQQYYTQKDGRGAENRGANAWIAYGR